MSLDKATRQRSLVKALIMQQEKKSQGFPRQGPYHIEAKASRPRGYKTFFMLNSGQHEIYHAHKCWNANNS